MAVHGSILVAAFLASFVAVCYGEVDPALLSALPVVLKVDTIPAKVNLQAGVGKIKVTWVLNDTSVGTSEFSKVAVKLCYRKESQIDRPWRKTENELFKDKTCQHDIAKKNYTTEEDSADYIVKKDVPTAHYFIRAYVVDAAGNKVAYGQSQDVDLFITAITGRHASIDIAAAVFSAFSVLSLGFFFYMEKKKANRDA